MNQILLGTMTVLAILGSAVIASTAITDTSMDSSDSILLDHAKSSENIYAYYDDSKIHVENRGAKNAEIVMFKFFDENSGIEINRVNLPDDTLRTFGTTNPISTITDLMYDDRFLNLHEKKSFSLSTLGLASYDNINGQILTSYGNTFEIELLTYFDASLYNSTGTETQSSTNATSVLNGFGINSLIYTISELGKIIWGNGVIGGFGPLMPYTPTDSSADFAAVVLDSDAKNTYSIPEFWGEYNYDGNSLIDVTTPLPNILGYSQSRDVIGSNTISITSNGIVISGIGSTIIKLNDYSSDRIILTGDVSSGGIVKLITPDNVDLINDSYGANGFTVPSSLPAVVGLDSTHYATASWTSGYTYRSQSCAGPSANGYYYVNTSYSVIVSSTTVSATITETDASDHALITGLSGYSATAPANTGSAVRSWCQHYLNSGVQDGWVSGVTLAIYDTLPTYTLLDYSSSFVEDYTFPAEQTYLYVEPNGVTVTILGQEVASTPTLVIDNLPASIPWQISKDGWIIASGVTSATGTITISEDDVSFDGFSTESGLLHLYPDSLTYRGAYTTICFDTENREIFHVTDSYDQMCVSSAFVSLPISMDVEINEISSGTVTFDYLAGNYTVGDSVSVPIIPQMKSISFILNGETAEINIKDITNTAQSKILSTVTDSNALYATGSAIENIKVDISNTAILIATHTGTMNAAITATASADATFTINSDYTGSYQQTYDICQAAMAAYGAANGCVQHGHPTDGRIMAALVAGQAALDGALTAHKSALESAIIAQGPLTVTATVFKNGVYVDTFEIFDNLNPIFTASSNLGLISVQNAKVVYASTTGSKIISIHVEAGDYIEIIVNVGIVVSGIPTPVDLDNAKIAGFALGTVTLHSGSITATMG